MTSNKTTRLASMLALLIASATALTACSEAQPVAAPEVVRPVKVVEIGATHDSRLLEYSGAVRARREAALGFRVAGKIIERPVDVGDRVEPGDLLARIDATDLALAVTMAEAELTASEKQVETAELVLERTRQLQARNVAAQSVLDEAALSQRQAIAGRDAAAAALQQAKNQFGYAELRADDAGIVTAVSADSGQVVAVGTPVVTVAVDGEKEIQIAVPETEILGFRRDMAVEVGFWNDNNLRLEGRVREVAGSADPQSRTYSVRISLPANARVLIGMTGTVRAAIGMERPLITIPLEALAEKNGATIVWIADPQSGTVHARNVEVVDFGPGGVRVAQGLNQHDLVVAAGTQFMEENLKVKLQQESDLPSVAAAGPSR
ncbi:efflux RND transporter periplasmic adaptor subunit [Aliihoeflea sp. PC F10.4]